MCGIIGFNGNLNSVGVLLKGLEELEYRGYDSAGISFFEGKSITTIKTVGKVSNLREKAETKTYDTTCGIGHTRWATHGGVSDTNCHPHSCGKVTLIHNGIIENYHELEDKLKETGRTPISQTDTEIAAMLLDSLYEGDAHKAIKEAVAQLEGSYAFCIMFADQPDVIYSIRHASPLVAARAEEGTIIASDMVALIQYSKDYFVLPEHHIAKLTKDNITVTTLDGKAITPLMEHVNWDISAAKKGGYEHFMLKEIHEQPDAIRNTVLPRIQKHEIIEQSAEAAGSKLKTVEQHYVDFSVDHIPDKLFQGVNRIIITACGTAMHAGLIGKVLFERLSRIPVTVDIASEFRYANPIIDDHTLVITISQSGETADTLAALRLAKENHGRTLSIVNVKGSSIARESDYVLYTHAGPEIAVASTKAYTSQLAGLYLIVLQFAKVQGKITDALCSSYLENLLSITDSVVDTLTFEKQVDEISKSFMETTDLFFIGRGFDYALSCEGSIKLKEISYIHSEAYAAGELKHGTLSLITEGIPVIALATQPDLYAKMISNIREVKARGANVILITYNGAAVEDSIYDHLIQLPKVNDEFTPFVAAIILQLFAYYTSYHRGLNVDQPRNLAKSVTVE